MRIVIADDEMIVREGLARLLADAGFEVVGTATDGRELLRAIRLTVSRRGDRRYQDAADAHR